MESVRTVVLGKPVFLLSGTRPRRSKDGSSTAFIMSAALEVEAPEKLLETARRNPDAVRAPDVAFISAERIPPDGLPTHFWELAPDLVVEIISPSNTPAEVQAKVREWLEAGVRVFI